MDLDPDLLRRWGHRPSTPSDMHSQRELMAKHRRAVSDPRRGYLGDDWCRPKMADGVVGIGEHGRMALIEAV